MSRFLVRCIAVVSIAVVSGCVAPYPSGGYAPVAVGPGYYEPYGFDYGGWGPGYFVGPGRRGGDFRRGGGPHAFRGAPAGRAVPSLPGGRGRGGGGGRLGGHAGGGGRR